MVIIFTITLNAWGDKMALTIGKALQMRRKQRGLTQIEAAEKAGISVTTLKDYECGRNKPTWTVLKALGTAYMCTPEKMMQYVDTWEIKIKRE